MKAEKLLGGYAAGNLTAEERRQLMEAALKDQALFDALADEEALRELLQDPEARARLMKALEVPAPRIVPFFRRPWVLGAAATLLLGMSATALYFREPAARYQPKALQEQLQDKSVEAEAPPAPAAKPARGMAPESKAAPAPPPSQPEPGLVSVPAAPQPAPAPLEDAVAEKPEPMPRMMKQEAQGASRQRQAAEVAASGGAGGYFGQVVPVWALEPLPEGRLRVRMRWQGPGHPVLILRQGGASAIIPGEIRTGTATFLVSPGPGAALDLYLLPTPPPDPSALPAEGPVEGWRQRIFPEK